MLSYLLGSVLSNVLFMILHVNPQGCFPKALNAKEEQQCLERLSQGDQEARQTLIEHNLRLVAHVVKKYYTSGADQDDLISIGTIGLIKAVSSFDRTKGIRFATFAARCIDNEILMYFRSLKKSSHDVYISDPIESDKEGNHLTLIDIIATDDTILDDIDTAIQISKLKKFILTLTEREQRIIEYRYGLGGQPPLTQREVAQNMKISRSYVSRIEKKALEQLRLCFETSTGLD